jgi:hypothetical protein
MSPRRTAISVLAVLLLHGCVPARIGPPGARPLPCPSASFFEPSRSFEFAVPAEGGTISLPHGHQIVFPRGAVPAGSRYRVSRARNEFAALRFDTIGTAPSNFSAPAMLTLNHAACGFGAPGSGFDIYLWGEDDVLRPRRGTNQGQRISAPIDHFSVYAIGSN